jgi:hypothetical protein
MESRLTMSLRPAASFRPGRLADPRTPQERQGRSLDQGSQLPLPDAAIQRGVPERPSREGRQVGGLAGSAVCDGGCDEGGSGALGAGGAGIGAGNAIVSFFGSYQKEHAGRSGSGGRGVTDRGTGGNFRVCSAEVDAQQSAVIHVGLILAAKILRLEKDPIVVREAPCQNCSTVGRTLCTKHQTCRSSIRVQRRGRNPRPAP